MDFNTGQQRPHDAQNLNGLHYLRVFYFNQPQRYLAFDNNSLLEVHVDANGAVPAEAMEILGHMAGSIRRIHPDRRFVPIRWELSQSLQLPGGVEVMLPQSAQVESALPGTIYEFTIRRPGGKDMKFSLQNGIKPEQQFNQEVNSINSADGSSRMQWVDVNGFHLAKNIVTDRMINQQFSVGYSAYQNGRCFAISNSLSPIDADASNLLDAIVQSIRKTQ